MSSFSSTVHLLSVSHSRFIINKFVFAEKGFDFNLLFSRVRVSGVCVPVHIYFLSTSPSPSLLSPVFTFDHILDFCVSHFSSVVRVCTWQWASFSICLFLVACVCAFFFVFGVFERRKKYTHRRRWQNMTKKTHTMQTNTNFKMVERASEKQWWRKKGKKAFKRFGPNDP